MIYKGTKIMYNPFSERKKPVNKFDGETKPTGQMYRMKVNRDTVRPESITRDSAGYTYNLPEYVVTPQRNPDNGSRRVITLEEMAQQAAMNKAINEGMNKAGNVGFEAAMLASMFPAAISAPAATGMGLLGGIAGSSTGAKIGQYLAGDEGAVYGGLVGGLIGGGLGAGATSSRIRSLINSPHTGKWTKFGNREYRLNPNTLGADGIPLESRVTQLSKAQIDNGWTIDSDGFAINPKIKGKRFVRNAEGKLISEDAYNQELNAANLNQRGADIQRKNELIAAKAQKEASKVYDQLDALGIKDLREENWFQGRPTSGEGAVTNEDLTIWRSHLPEYLQKAEEFVDKGALYQKDKSWYGKFSDGDKKVNPAEYIVAHSDAFNKAGYYYDGVNRMRAMPTDEYVELVKNGGLGRTKWTTDDRAQVGVFSNEGKRKGGKTIQTIVGNVDKKDWILRPTEHAREAHELKSGVEYSPNVGYKGTTGNYTNFGWDVPIKSLRGNNGNFSGKGLYKGILPPALALGVYDTLIKDKYYE